jgi:hypothetical protein
MITLEWLSGRLPELGEEFWLNGKILKVLSILRGKKTRVVVG